MKIYLFLGLLNCLLLTWAVDALVYSHWVQLTIAVVAAVVSTAFMERYDPNPPKLDRDAL